MTNFEQISLGTPVAEAPSLREQMESQMSVSWSQIDTFISSFEGRDGDSRKAWGDDWFEGKKEIFKAWGNKLRIEKDAVLGVDFRDVYSSVTQLIQDIEVEEGVRLALKYALSHCGSDEVIENKLLENKNWFGIRLGKGMKLSKALGRLIRNDKERDSFQTAFSMLLQSYKVSGKVVLSIDPIDILAMSYNPDSEWRSCHNIIDGEFRAGVTSYLVDSSTFIGYAYRRTGATSYGIEIPNKTWRQIGYFDTRNTAVALSTHYPSVNKNNRVTLVELLLETMGFTEDQVGMGFVDAEDISEFMYNEGYHYNDIVEGRESKSYCIDFTGESLRYTDEGQDILRRYFDKDYSGEFKIGSDDVVGFDCQGTIDCSESITSYSYYDDEDDDW